MEKKICDGIYIVSSNKKTENGNQYVYKNSSELLSLLESEFDELGNTINSLFKSNEEMLAFDPHDYDLIEAREENLVLIYQKMDRMKAIQKEIEAISPIHPVLKVDIFEFFKKNLDNNNNQSKEKEETADKKEDIITEIDL